MELYWAKKMHVTNRVTSRKNFSIVILSLLLALLMIEFILRHFDKIKTYTEIVNLKGKPYIAAHSSYLPFTLPKNISFPHRTSEFEVVYDINNYGYRGNFPRSIRKPQNRKRILIVGDSFTLGWGNEIKNTFVQQIQDCLNPEEYSVINAAYHAGYSPDSYYAYLVKEGIELSPDIVLVVLYGNDVRDIMDNIWLETDDRGAPTKILTTRLYMDYQGNLIHPAETLVTFLPWNYKIPVFKNSYTFIAISQVINMLLNIGSFSDPFLWEKLTKADAWQSFDSVIKSLSKWSKENGVELIYVTIPPKPKGAKDNRIDEKITYLIKNKFNFRLIDMRPHLSEEAYYVNDAHFNKLGNKITSTVIIEYLVRNNFITLKKHKT